MFTNCLQIQQSFVIVLCYNDYSENNKGSQINEMEMFFMYGKTIAELICLAFCDTLRRARTSRNNKVALTVSEINKLVDADTKGDGLTVDGYMELIGLLSWLKYERKLTGEYDLSKKGLEHEVEGIAKDIRYLVSSWLYDEEPHVYYDLKNYLLGLKRGQRLSID